MQVMKEMDVGRGLTLYGYFVAGLASGFLNPSHSLIQFLLVVSMSALSFVFVVKFFPGKKEEPTNRAMRRSL